MKILLATADADELRWATERQWVDGVFTTPSLLAQSGDPGESSRLLSDAYRITGGPVYASVQSMHGGEMYDEARELARAADQAIVVLPLLEESVPVIRRLSSEGVSVAASFVHNGAQALLAAKAGAAAVIVPFAEHETFGHSGFAVLAEVRAVLDAARVECDLVAIGLRSSSDVGGCASAGTDALVLEPDALRAFLQHPLTDRGFDGYLRDLSRLTRPRAV